jgi:hypothetical protein
MNNIILEDGSLQRNHRARLNALFAASTGTVRIAAAYVTDRELLSQSPER